MHEPFLSIALRGETDIVLARQRARQVAVALHMDTQDTARIAAAVSEIARNALQYGGGGRVGFAYAVEPEHSLWIRVTSPSTGLDPHAALAANGGLSRTKRLMDEFTIATDASTLVVDFAKELPANAPRLSDETLVRLAADLATREVNTPLAEMRQHNVELLQALEELKARQEEMVRLNRELADTNSGVLALYAELEEQTLAVRRGAEAKARFYSEMNHEVRTPINAIRSLAELLLGNTLVAPLPEQEKPLGFIRKSAKQLSELIDDLLDLAKMEAGKMPLRASFFDVSDLFAALRGMFRPLHTNAAVELQFEAADHLPPVYSDEAKVAQVLRNFISNAIKFTEQGHVKISAHLEDNAMVFSVADTGIGIALDDQKRLFDAFSQIESPQQRRVKGTGLGLSVSRNLATLLNGELTLQSELHKGATFFLRLPMVATESKPASGRVLIVDDDDVTRYLLAKSLSSPTLQVCEAPDGLSGLREVEVTRPDAIILDLTMPGVPGETVLEMLKANPNTRNIPVLVYTAKALTPKERAAIESRAVAIFSKTGQGYAHEIADVLSKLANLPPAVR